MTWATRTELAGLFGGGADVEGLLLGAVPGEGFVAVPRKERAGLFERSAATLSAAGLSRGDRAILSLNSDGDLAGAMLADALVELGAAAGVVGARGRMRLLGAIRAIRPNVWVTTPTGALDFLARLYLEFNVDPMELDLEKILLVGEIASPGTERRLADEFESRVTSLYCDPVFGVALAHSESGVWQVHDSAMLGLAELDRDEWLERIPGSAGDGLAELVLRPVWSPPLANWTLRTGQVVGGAADASLFAHTVGEHLLIRGRWLSLPLLRRALAGIDGISGWRLTASRGDGTLDKLTLTLAFERPSLVENPMWAGRAREAVAAITPIAFELETEVASEGMPAETIVDERGHHLGVDRAAALRDPAG